MTENNDTLQIRISADLKERLKKHCESNIINQSALVRKLIEDYLKEK